jgi:predicted acylesterase/phospholipase RssA
MKPFRKHVAIAVDGGGIRGVMVTRALTVLEKHLGLSCGEVFSLAAGTSTGSIISAGIGLRKRGAEMHALYCELATTVFPKTWRYYLWPLCRHKYPNDQLIAALKDEVGEMTMGEFWTSEPKKDVVITVRDLAENRTRFVKPWKPEYQGWKVWKAVLSSCSVPTYFPVVDGRYVDGGVGSYNNPCYLAAYEAQFCLRWDPQKTTLISLGTGRVQNPIKEGEADRWFPWNWIVPVLDTFLSDTADQQVRLVHHFFPDMDFRRFQIDLDEPIGVDDVSKIDELIEYGDRLGQMIINDEGDSYVVRSPGVVP